MWMRDAIAGAKRDDYRGTDLLLPHYHMPSLAIAHLMRDSLPRTAIYLAPIFSHAPIAVAFASERTGNSVR